MEAIIDHKMTDDAVQKEDMYFMLRGRKSDMKESYPIEVAEYATALGIQDEPAFAWWTNDVLQK